MAGASQAESMINDNGIMCTIGYIVNGDYCACVLPFATDGTIDKNESCSDFLNAFEDGPLDDFIALLSSDVYISFIAADGMIDGIAPWRFDFAVTDKPGTRGANPAPAQVSALLFFYEDGRDVDDGAKISIGKNFVSGISQDDLLGDIISDDLVVACGTFLDDVQNGFTDAKSNKWYRVLSKPAGAPGQPIKRTYNTGVRGYVCTQKRRLIPRH